MAKSDKSLIEKAKDVPIRKFKDFKFTGEELELVQAWLDGEVSLSQMSRVLNKSFNQVYTFIATGCRELYGKNRK